MFSKQNLTPYLSPVIKQALPIVLCLASAQTMAGAAPERFDSYYGDETQSFNEQSAFGHSDNVQSAIDRVKDATRNASRSGQGLRSYSVSADGPNRVAVADRKIVNAIYDQTLLEVQTDEITGQIFVFPRTKAPVALFLTTDRNETHSLTLVPDARMSQEIILGSRSIKEPESYKRPSTSLPVETASNIDTTLKNLIVALARNELPVSMTATNRCGDNCLRRFIGEEISGEVLVYKNKTSSHIALSERLFYEAGILAVAIENTELAAGQSTRVYRVYRLAR